MLFHWVYFTSFFDHYIEQDSCFYSFRSSHWEIFFKIAATSVVNQLKYPNESVPFSFPTLLKLSFFTDIFQRFNQIFLQSIFLQSVWYSAEQLFWRIFIFRSSSLRKCSVKKVSVKFSQNSQESASVRISF